MSRETVVGGKGGNNGKGHPVHWDRIEVGKPVILNGTLHVDSYGSATGRTFQNYPCYVSKIVDDHDRACPILLGDNNSNMLGWVSIDEIFNA